jgi:hypothetical protein
MRNPVRSLDSTWRVRIGFILVGAIFVLSQFLATPPAVHDDVKVAGSVGTVPADATKEIDAD